MIRHSRRKAGSEKSLLLRIAGQVYVQVLLLFLAYVVPFPSLVSPGLTQPFSTVARALAGPGQGPGDTIIRV